MNRNIISEKQFCGKIMCKKHVHVAVRKTQTPDTAKTSLSPTITKILREWSQGFNCDTKKKTDASTHLRKLTFVLHSTHCSF